MARDVLRRLELENESKYSFFEEITARIFSL